LCRLRTAILLRSMCSHSRSMCEYRWYVDDNDTAASLRGLVRFFSRVCLSVCSLVWSPSPHALAWLAPPPNHHPLLTAFLSHTYTPCTCVSLFCFPLSGGDEDAIRKLEAADPPAHAGSHHAEQVLPVRKAPSFEPFYAHRMIILPRQARDNHRKS
jgi:hypothetical protein